MGCLESEKNAAVKPPAHVDGVDCASAGRLTKKSLSTLHEVNLKTISPRLLLTFFTGGEVTKYPPA